MYRSKALSCISGSIILSFGVSFFTQVVAIHLLVLDSSLNDLQTAEAINKGKVLKVKVPQAAFIVGKRYRLTLVFLQHSILNQIC